MSLPFVLEHIDLSAGAPEGVKRLRELILELAVRGKLVPQNPNDEPASELLKRIAKERARLEADGTCRKSKATPLTDEGARPFPVPAGWLWVRLAEIGHDWGQKTPDADFTYVDVSAIDNVRGLIDTPTVVAAGDAPSRARKIVQRGTVIYSTIRPYLLNIAVIDRDLTPSPIASTAFAVIHPLAGLSSQFIFWYLRSPPFVRYVESVQTGIAYPAVNDSQFFSGWFPLPPLAEQHRIVAKVDELMALCDRLEAEQTDAGAAHAKLVATLLGTLTQSADAAELAANWQRLAEHFDTLFTTESSLDALKQTILQLAVMGKLVPQDPNDEPASELLKRIAKERARLEVEGTCKKSKPVPPVGKDEQPFGLPDGWQWARAQETFDVRDGTHHTPKYVEGDGIPLITSRNFDDGKISFGDAKLISVKDHEAIKRRSGVSRGDILYSMIGGNIGNQVVVDTDREFSIKNVALFKYYRQADTLPMFLNLFLKTVTFGLKRNASGGAQPFVALSLLRNIPIALPPVAEQHRIVAKVDELMALCDRLKAGLAESRAQQERLATTLIESALKAA